MADKGIFAARVTLGMLTALSFDAVHFAYRQLDESSPDLYERLSAGYINELCEFLSTYERLNPY